MRKIFKTSATIVLILIVMSTLVAAPVLADDNIQKIRVGFFAFDGYHMIDENDEKSGYGYDYLQSMARYTNWVYDYVGYDKSWAEMQTMLENGEIDLLTSAQKTASRMEKFDFSDDAIGTSYTILTVKEGNQQFLSEDYENYNGMRVGMIKLNSRNLNFADFAAEKGFFQQETSPERIQQAVDDGCISDTEDSRASLYAHTTWYDSTDAMIAALQDGSVDAIVSSNLRAIDNEWVIASFNPSDFYVMVRKGDTALLSQVNTAINQVKKYEPTLKDELFDKYYSLDEQEQISFTASELSYIDTLQAQGTKIKAVIKPGRQPLSTFENGVPVGIVPDIMTEISKRTGLEFDIVETATETEYEKMAASDAVVLKLDTGMNYSEAETANYKCTDPYLDLSLSAISLKNNADRSTIAAVRDTRLTKRYIEKRVSREDITYYDTLEECVEAVKKGKQDVAFADTFSVQRILSEDATNRLTNFVVVGFTSQLQIGVKTNAPVELLTILNKGVSSLGNNQIKNIVNTNCDFKNQAYSFIGFMYNNPFLAGTVLCAFFVVLLGLILTASHHRRLNLEESKNREFERFIKYVCKSNDEVSELDIEEHCKHTYRVDGDKVIVDTNPLNTVEDARVHPEDFSKLAEILTKENIQRLVDSNDEIYLEYRLKNDQDDYEWHAFTIQGMTRDKQHPNSCIVFNKNIDAAKKLEEQQRQQLQDALAMAQSASAAKGSFMSRMSHEIRTPLNAIIGYITLEKTCDTVEELQSYVEKSEIAAKNLLGLLNDILDISSIESGRMKIANALFDFKKLISSISTMYYSQCTQKGITFETILTDITEESLIGDRLRLNQILLNLLSNAVKFTPPNGKITLSILQQNIHNNRVYLCFSVTDTGIGMDEDFRSRLFLPFEQESADTAQMHGGSGLGLSITKNLVDMMEGTIWVDSQKGRGTTFKVTLPFGYDDNHTRSQLNESYDFSHVHVLIVDDEENVRDYLGLLMHRCHVNFEVAKSGMEAVQKLSQAVAQGKHFDLCLMDWKMPGLDGIETVKLFQEISPDKLPIVIVTGYDFSEIEGEAKAVGINHIVSKPLFQSTLFDILVSNYGGYTPKDTTDTFKHDFTGTHILIAEDNYVNMDIAVRLLKKVGVTTDEAANGQEALDKFTASAPGTYDAIFMDVQMPIMDGYTATKKIRGAEHPDAKTIPIFAMTANAFQEDVAKSLDAGMNEHISKPMDADILFDVLGSYLSKKN